MPQLRENKMGTMSVPRLIVNMSFPMMISMFIQSLYNIVDSALVGRINENALTALSLAFPLQNLMVAFGIGTAVGVNALLSTRLGQKKMEDVNRAAMNGIFLALCTYLFILLLSFFILHPYFVFSAKGVAQIVSYGEEYASIVMRASFGMFGVMMLDRLLQATGRTIFTMISQISGAFCNIILDCCLIFGLGPFPKLGVAGAAIATVIGQCLSMVLSLVFNLAFNREIKFEFRKFRPHLATIRQVYLVALPTILLNGATSLTTYLLNLILGMFSTTAIAVYGVYFKLNSFLFMPIFGLNSGLVPIIAYNYGACKKKRILSTMRTGLLFALSIMGFGVILFELIPGRLLMLFSATNEMLKIGVPAIRIIAPSFIGAAVAITLSSAFQAFRSAIYSMIVAFMRQLVVLLPVAYFLALTGNIRNVWFAFPIAEVVSVAVSIFFYMRLKKNRLMPMQEE
ncbi:MAG: MATE family efflux transporter [Treponema sp.]|nr:MATE family efflux transporter [Treponema sp.]